MSECVKLMAVGDIMLGDHPVRFGHGVKSTIEKSGGVSPFARVEGLLAGNDIVFGNVEAVLSDHGLMRGNLLSEEFRGSPTFIPMLASAGFNVVSFANNHCMEHGSDAFWDTVNRLKVQNIQIAGLSLPSGSCKPVEMSIRGCNVLLLSYSLCPENYYKGSTVPYAHQQDFEKVLEDVKSFRGQADLLLISLHWGYEYVDYPSPKQVQLAHRLVDEAGVNLIIGHHPHVLQAVERYQKAVIVYSLGNFVFDMWQHRTRESMIFAANISSKGDLAFDIRPITLGRDYRPAPIDKPFHKPFFHRMVELENQFKTQCLVHDFDDTALVNSLEEEYLGLAKGKETEHRISSYLYFARNIYRYDLRILFQSLMRSFARRLESNSNSNP
jgi:hypothetical protein